MEFRGPYGNYLAPAPRVGPGPRDGGEKRGAGPPSLRAVSPPERAVYHVHRSHWVPVIGCGGPLMSPSCVWGQLWP